MSFVIFPKIFSAGDHLRGSDLNGILDAIKKVINGGISNENLSSSLLDKIDESKVKFNTVSGHSHNGTDGKRIILPPIILGLTGEIWQGLRTPSIQISEDRPITKVVILVNVAGTGDTTLELEILKPDGSEWTTLNTWTLAAGQTKHIADWSATLGSETLIRLVITATSGTPPEGATLEMWQSLT